MRNAVRLGGRLLAIALIAGLALGATYFFTKEPIERQTALAAAKARSAVMPGESVLDETAAPSGNVRAVYTVPGGGRIVEVNAAGYGGAFLVTVGIAADGTVTGVFVGDNQETAGLGKNAEKPAFTDQFKGADGPVEVVKGGAGGNRIDALTGATITSRAVADAVNEARAFALSPGGEVQ